MTEEQHSDALRAGARASAPADMLATFYEDLLKAPNDWKLRSVLGDWFEDNGRPQDAECLRWMVRHQKRAYFSSGKSFAWFNAETISENLGDPESDIPAAIYKQLEGGVETANHKSYRSLRAAEEAFRAAWAKARAAGWRPDA